MADSVDTTASTVSRPAGSLLQWGIAAACTAFFWALVSVVSEVWPTTFPVLVRGSGLQVYTTSFTIISPVADQLLLIVCSAFILLILELRIRHLGYLGQIVFMLPALMLAAFPLFPVLLLPVGAAGTIVGAIYLILDSSELLGVPPARILAAALVVLTAFTAAVFFFSAVRWALNPIDGAAPLSGWTWSPSVLALKLLNWPYALLPGLILLLFICWPLRLVLGAYWDDLRGYVARFSQRFAPTDGPGIGWLAPDRSPLLLVVAALAGALFVGLYPYFPRINPTSMIVGVDVLHIQFYYASLQQMVSQGPLSVVGNHLQAPRAGFLLFEYGLARLTGSVDLAVRIVPAFLSILFAVTTYLFVRSGSRDRLLAGTSSLFAAFSIQVVAGINGGIDADWLAASESLLFLSLLLVGLNRSDRRYVVASIMVSALILLTHPWTWFITMGVVAAYGLLTGARALVTGERENLRFELASVGSVFVFYLVLDGAKYLLGSSSGLQDVSSSLASLSLANLPHVLSSLQSTVTVYLGGALDNSIIVVLAIVGLLTMPDLRSRMNRLLLSWVAVASVGILFFPYSVAWYQARTIILVPLQVLAAVGFLLGLRYFAGLMSAREYENQGLVKAFVIVSYVSVFGAMMGYALLNLGFLYTG